MNQGIIVAACWLAITATPTTANGQEHRQWGRFDSVHIDQDLFAPGNQDRNYTMGLRFTWQGDKAERHLLNTFGALRAVDDALGLAYEGDRFPSVSFGNSAFTPDDLRRVDPIRDDRPYSSLLYTASSVVAQQGDRAVESKLVLGVLGLSISEWAQTRIHVVNRSLSGGETPYDPKGWANQISDGGEPTAMYQRSWMRRIPMRSRLLDAAGSCEMYAGYYAGASCGAVWKFGRFEKLETPFWTMLGDINPQADASGIVSIAPARALVAPLATSKAPWLREWYFLFGARGRVVAYNELLQGGFRHTDHVLRGGEIERLVGEVSIGVNVTFGGGSRWMFTCTERSPEHELAERRSHRWCGLNYFRPR